MHVYTDGSVQVNHGGTEMGQGLNTKVAQIVADELGVPFERVLATASDTSKVPNAIATAASSGTDLNGRAAQFAARHVRDNLAAFVGRAGRLGAGAVRFEGGQVITPKTTRSFEDVVGVAYANRIQLWSDGFYRTPKIHYDKTTLTGRPFYYFAYGAACTEVAIDTLTGESRVLKVDILHDVGTQHQPGHRHRPDRRRLRAGHGLAHHRATGVERQGLPAAPTRPAPTRSPPPATCPRTSRSTSGPKPTARTTCFGSKAVGEPPFMLAISVFEALRDAVASARGGAPAARTAIRAV